MLLDVRDWTAGARAEVDDFPFVFFGSVFASVFECAEDVVDHVGG